MPVFSENFYIIGHRGAAGERFENSLEGFKHALTLDIDAIEIDIREHSSELWVIHDDDLERLTGSAGLFAQHANPSMIRLRNGEAVPTLRQVLDLYWGRMPVNIEIKSVANLNLLLDLLSEYPAPKPVVGLPWIAAKLKQIAPFSWHFDDEYLDFGLLQQLGAQGVQSLVFTVNDVNRAQYLRQQGVGGIFTDIPTKMAQIS
jgi:glycerophosphoryl diester phosphodiesterase